MPHPQHTLSVFTVATTILLSIGCSQQDLRPLTGAPDADAELLTAAESVDGSIQRSRGKFLEMLAEEDRVIIVDFWGPHCPPCRQLAPELEKVVRENSGRVSVVKVDVESAANAPLAKHFGIHAIPEMRVFVNGNPTEVLYGYLSASRITSRIEPSLSTLNVATAE